MLTRVSRRPLFLALAVFFLSSHAQEQASGWTNPPSYAPAFTSTYTNGDFITLSWQGLNNSLSDLWFTSFDANNRYAFRIAANINITLPGTLPWSITVNDTEIGIDNRFELKFVPTRTDINQNELFDQIVSPGFFLLQNGGVVPVTSTPSAGSESEQPTIISSVVAGLTSMTTVPTTISTDASGATPEATSAFTPVPSSEASSSSSLSPGARAGIAIAAVTAVAIILALLFWALRLRQRVKAASNKHSWGILPDSPTDTAATASSITLTEKHIPGLHEVLGDRRQPAELLTTGDKDKDKQPRRSIYEMAG